MTGLYVITKSRLLKKARPLTKTNMATGLIYFQFKWRLLIIQVDPILNLVNLRVIIIRKWIKLVWQKHLYYGIKQNMGMPFPKFLPQGQTVLQKPCRILQLTYFYINANHNLYNNEIKSIILHGISPYFNIFYMQNKGHCIFQEIYLRVLALYTVHCPLVLSSSSN